jgi:hypothetical protein
MDAMARELPIHKCHPRLTLVGKVLTGNGISRWEKGTDLLPCGW